MYSLIDSNTSQMLHMTQFNVNSNLQDSEIFDKISLTTELRAMLQALFTIF